MSRLRGYVANKNSQTGKYELPTDSMSIRVPVQNYETALTALRALGKVTSESQNGEDVTAQVADTEARLKVMKIEEQQYMALLRTTKHVADILSVKDRLGSVRADIESLDATRKTLRDQATYSTIDLTIAEPPKEPAPEVEVKHSWIGETWTGSVDALKGLGQTAGRLSIIALVFSPLWIPLGFLARWYVKR